MQHFLLIKQFWSKGVNESFEDVLLNGDESELNDLKRFLFEENVRLSIKQKELQEMHEKFLAERIQFQEEMKQINLRVVTERKRLNDEETFFDKKMQILKNGFSELERDRETFEYEKKLFYSQKAETERKRSQAINDDVITGLLFAGVNNTLALKKRYRDLLKIFHPDNLCGDNTMVAIINKEYERLKKEIDYPFKNVN